MAASARRADRSPHAIAATKRLLDEFERGSARLDEWEHVRLDILASTERRERVERAKARLGLA